VSLTDWQLIDDGSFNGMRKYIRSSDENQGTVQVRYEQDATALLDANKRSQAAKAGTRMGDGLEKVASIPACIVYEWITKHGINLYNPNHQDGVKRLLNSSDYRWLKCREIIL
jgi:hypothetical protein